MKSVKDPAALKALALKSGATVTDDSGGSFNTKKRKAVEPKRLEPEVPLPKPKPEPPKPVGPDTGSIKVSEAIIDAGKTNVKMLEQIKQGIADIKMSAVEPITHWEFEFIRDSKGYTVKVICEGSSPVKVLN